MDSGIGKVDVFIQTIGASSPMGHKLRATYEQAVMEVGGGPQLFDLNYATFSPLLTPHTWVGSLWEFLSRYDIRLYGHPLSSRPSERRLHHTVVISVLHFSGSYPGL